MLGNLLKGGLVGGLILFAFQSISWTVLPWHAATIKGFPNEPAVRQALAGFGAGVYLLPNPKTMDNSQAAAGPLVFASVKPEGAGAMGPAMGVQFAAQVLCALLCTWLLLKTKGLSYLSKACFFTAIGVIVALAGHVPNWVWWGFPPAYIGADAADLLIGWSLAGLALGKLIKTD